MTRRLDALHELVVDPIANTTNPARRFVAATEVLDELDAVAGTLRALRAAAADRLHGELGMTYAEIGGLIGVTPQRAAKLSERPTLPKGTR